MAAAEATTSSVQALREYIIERLSVAAVEIFTVFERTLVQYEEQMDRQRGLLDITEIKLHGEGDLPQQHACKMEQLCNQERSSPLCQQEAAPPQIKEEQEELVTSLEGVQLLLRQEADDFREVSAGDESDHSEAQPDSVVRLFAKPYSCSECSKSFIRRCNMRRHQRTHTGEKPYSCSECGKSFVRQCHLLTHEKTHSGERPYFCSECGKSFTRRNNLMTHKKTHTGEKPYSCSECGKRFNRSTNLMTHKRTHTGEKPYACSKCPKSFSRRSSLTVHMSTHRGEKQYLCT